MKKLLLPILIALSTIAHGQCDITKCINESLTANSTTSAANPTYLWAIAPALGFTGQGTASIAVADVGAIVQNYTFTLTVTDGITGCTNTETFVLCVQTGVATLTLPQICSTDPCIPVSGGSGVGIYEINGVPVTQLCASDAGALVTFTSTSGTCPGVATATFTVNPQPTLTITPN